MPSQQNFPEAEVELRTTDDPAEGAEVHQFV